MHCLVGLVLCSLILDATPVVALTKTQDVDANADICSCKISLVLAQRIWQSLADNEAVEEIKEERKRDLARSSHAGTASASLDSDTDTKKDKRRQRQQPLRRGGAVDPDPSNGFIIGLRQRQKEASCWKTRSARWPESTTMYCSCVGPQDLNANHTTSPEYEFAMDHMFMAWCGNMFDRYYEDGYDPYEDEEDEEKERLPYNENTINLFMWR